ncbi:hypothetical protein [Xanthocytophaga agilis]|uniref:Uncharacterized protein n=1 Tax=Xanthocytophaga agilis TaxID=3048010 RepID=A0AAE3R8M6_9BACT|nr:hypothetical protein [Xanthocytophaga agilis]MDJ1503419.1 hypothetical protein [Xanthocytophaga agilis]
MHKLCYCKWLTAIVLSAFCHVSYAQRTLQPKEKRTYAVELLKKYNPEGWKILRQVDSLAFHHPYDQYVEGNTEFDVRNSLGTIVHEMNHGYASLLAGKLKPKDAQNYMCYYLGSDEYHLVKFTDVFPTEKMGRNIPKNLRTFRFDTYIYNPKESIALASNTLGIYGLMDEWVAYYHGTLTDVNMNCWYEENTPGNAEDWYDYFSNVCSAINAHQEFKFFCLSYLVYAQKYYPQDYKALMQNHELVETFLKVNELFTQLVKKYEKTKEKIFTDLRAKGVKVVEEDEWIYLNRFGAGNYLTEYKLLGKEMQKPAYQQMLQNLKGANKLAMHGSFGRQ